MLLPEIIQTTRDWLNLGDDVYPDSMVTSMVRFAEEYLSETVRCKHMVQLDYSLLNVDRVLLPSDWLELELVHFPGVAPLVYSPRDEFYDPRLDNRDRYTILGNYIVVNPVDKTNGTNVEISYFQSIPPVSNDTGTWLFDHYPRLGILTTLLQAGMYSIEDERTPMWTEQVNNFIDTINMRHRESKSRGSKLISRQKSNWRYGNAESGTLWRDSSAERVASGAFRRST